jgi:PKD repeat protein/N-acetylneuraminic acid mutarotase
MQDFNFLSMKKFIIILLFLSQNAVNAQFSWVQKDSLPALGRYSLISFVIGDKAYAGLGAIDAEQRIYSAGLFSYDPAVNSWTQLPDFPGGGRYGATAFTVNGKGYVCLGVDNTHNWRSDVWEYNPVTGNWSQKSAFPGGDRYSAYAFVIGNNAYVIGGSVNLGENYLNDLWCYTPETDAWTRKADLPTDHKSGAVSFSINGKGYVVCGARSTFEPTRDFYEYNPLTDSWYRLPDLPGIRSGAVGFVIGDTAYVGTGSDLNLTYTNLWRYSPGMTSWIDVTAPPADFSKRIAGTAFSIGNTGYVLAGRSEPYDPFYNNGKMLSDLWAYTTCLPPIADFSYETDLYEVKFSDSSSGATTWHWNFGDGTFSNEKDPVHIFTPGIYNVCHSAGNGCGMDSICKTIEIICQQPVAHFLSSYNYPYAQFTDSSTTGYLISRLWNFGDSTTSSESNPLHMYNAPGIYHACLTVTDSCGTNTGCEDIYLLLPMTLSISATPAATNDLLANFDDLTPGTTNWKWTFGDGGSSDLKNPSHLYREYGNYQVCLRAWNSQYLGNVCDTLLMEVNPLLHMANPVIIYPNPTHGKVFVRFYKSFSASDIFAEDQYGNRLFYKHITSPGLMSPTEIDLSGLSAGVYFVHVNCDNYQKVWKIIIY